MVSEDLEYSSFCSQATNSTVGCVEGGGCQFYPSILDFPQMESLVNFRALAGLQLSTRCALEGKNS